MTTAALALAVLEALGPTRRTHPGAEARARIYAAQVELAATASRIDPYLVVALIERESGWNPHALGAAGERGLMQIHPAGGAWAKYGPVSASWDASYSPPINIRVGTAWLAWKRHHCETDDPVKFLSAYHGGKCRATPYSRAIVARAGALRGMAAALVVSEGGG